MLSAARVFVIFAGLFGLPSVACSGACSAALTAAAVEGQQRQGAAVSPTDAALASSGVAIYNIILLASLGASVGAIVVGAKAPKWGRVKSGTFCLIFAACFGMQLLQFNVLGVVSALLLVVGAIMIFVAPLEQFTGVVKVQVQHPI